MCILSPRCTDCKLSNYSVTWSIAINSPTTMSEATTVPANGNGNHENPADQQQEPVQQQSILTRSWHAIFSPFSPSALATLPNLQRPARYLRLDDIPETATDGEGQQPTVRDYHAINSVPPQVRVPKKIPTSIKVESKVWFANERSEFFCFFSIHAAMNVCLVFSVGLMVEHFRPARCSCSWVVQCFQG